MVAAPRRLRPLRASEPLDARNVCCGREGRQELIPGRSGEWCEVAGSESKVEGLRASRLARALGSRAVGRLTAEVGHRSCQRVGAWRGRRLEPKVPGRYGASAAGGRMHDDSSGGDRETLGAGGPTPAAGGRTDGPTTRPRSSASRKPAVAAGPDRPCADLRLRDGPSLWPLYLAPAGPSAPAHSRGPPPATALPARTGTPVLLAGTAGPRRGPVRSARLTHVGSHRCRCSAPCAPRSRPREG
jgi:hypothetical protein